jgi:hypothetical protein
MHIMHINSQLHMPCCCACLQGLEGRLPMHSQITRGGIYCEHANVLEGTPSSFSARVNRMRQLSGYIPAQVRVSSAWAPDRHSSPHMML